VAKMVPDGRRGIQSFLYLPYPGSGEAGKVRYTVLVNVALTLGDPHRPNERR